MVAAGVLCRYETRVCGRIEMSRHKGTDRRGGFRKHQTGASHGAAADMHEMPVVRVSVGAGALTHRRDKHAVRKCKISNRERIKQVSHRSGTNLSDVRGSSQKKNRESLPPIDA